MPGTDVQLVAWCKSVSPATQSPARLVFKFIISYDGLREGGLQLSEALKGVCHLAEVL